MSHDTATLLIAAVIATHNRPKLLAQRSLKSITKQTRPPDILVVVDDSDPDIRHSNRTAVYNLETKIDTIYMQNNRTPGAAGAWNTALSYLYDVSPSCFVAILDDDDSWDAEYLRQCEEAVLRDNLDMVSAGIIYHEYANQKMYDPPDHITVKDLLERNTHIQGSNIFTRLCKLLHAGGFDEALVSTTDRDICIRLADIRTVRYGALKRHLVHHYADSDRPRLSTPNSKAKHRGLDYFYSKHKNRMPQDVKSAFIRRSFRLFGWTPQNPKHHYRLLSHKSTCNIGGHLDLTVGAITSPDVTLIERLLDSLIHTLNNQSDVTLKVILLENSGHDTACRNTLKKAVQKAQYRSLDVTIKTLEQQAADAKSFHTCGRQRAGCKSIAQSRTMLQHYLYLEALHRAGTVVWILDDDIVLEGLTYGDGGVTGACDIDYKAHILRLKETDADVILCKETGDPPLPAPGCIRTQLVDIYHNLLCLANMDPGDLYYNRVNENRTSRLCRRDYYYDLSGVETDHLELPFWYETRQENLTVGQAFSEMVSRLPDILNGIQVFRPLTYVEPIDVLSNVAPSISRGPSTIIFDIGALRDFPNVALSVDGTDMRRSDMMWSLLNRFVSGRNIVKAQMPIRQIRKPTDRYDMGLEVMFQDILGHALYSSIRDVFKMQLRDTKDIIHYNDMLRDHQIKEITKLNKRYIHERVHSFELNYMRVMGLLSALQHICRYDTVRGSEPWWLKSAEYSNAVSKLQKFVESIKSIYTHDNLDNFKQKMCGISDKTIERFIRDLPYDIDGYRDSMPPEGAICQRAATHIKSEFSVNSLKYLGIGKEGVVFTDNNLVYKYFHDPNIQSMVPFLLSLIGKMSACLTLPDILEVRRSGDSVVLVYPYEFGVSYTGGHLQSMLTLIRDCQRVGIACRNIHPDNILMVSSGLKLVDYGIDIVPINDAEFEQMCRRAFLTYRFAFRSDLKSVMRCTLTDDAVAELHGLEHFKNALEMRRLDTLFYKPLSQLIIKNNPRCVLDYGCGDGRMAGWLAKRGVEVIGYDPDITSVIRCLNRGKTGTCGSTKLRDQLLDNSVRFDVVMCGRVLCTMHDDSEFDVVLRDLRRLVSDSGAVFVAVCNPFYLDVTYTELATKHLPKDFGYMDTFTYHKTLSVNGNRRVEVHRNYTSYTDAFARAGLSVQKVWDFDGTDVSSILPASEHLVFQLNPMMYSEHKISLLIKTCITEWRIVERLVRHQIKQLEMCTDFVEKVIIVDSSDGPFLRQHDNPDHEAHQTAMNRLLHDKVVDRVVYTPSDAKIIRSVYKRWFGVESTKTHSAMGQQLFATLFGFEQCMGDYVLQIDSDLIIKNLNSSQNHITDMVNVLLHDEKALFVSMSICLSKDAPYTFTGPDGDWRVEVRGCLYDRQRLASVLPIYNEFRDGRFTLSWHRAFDAFIASGQYRCYRGGNTGTGFIHVPNSCKRRVDELFDVIKSVERGYVPDVQLGCVNLVGSGMDWAGPKRSERFVFVICGHNVNPGRFKQCILSILAQKSVPWGAILIDDASSNGFGDYAEVLLSEYMDNTTIIRNEQRRGSLYNTWRAITQFCVDPETVIITLDADDALIGECVLERVRAEYDDGADVTVGSMLRLDKEATYDVNFENPRRPDSNVWQHLRTFKKYLFDAIKVRDLKIDDQWIDVAADWAFMVPIIEMASHPRFIPDKVYLYQPATPKDNAGRQHRDQMIGRILLKAPYDTLR